MAIGMMFRRLRGLVKNALLLNAGTFWLPAKPSSTTWTMTA